MPKYISFGKCFIKKQDIDHFIYLAKDLPDDMQQKIGSEMNLAETAFIKTIDAGDSFASGKSIYLFRSYTRCNNLPLAAGAGVFLRDNMDMSRMYDIECVLKWNIKHISKPKL